MSLIFYFKGGYQVWSEYLVAINYCKSDGKMLKMAGGRRCVSTLNDCENLFAPI